MRRLLDFVFNLLLKIESVNMNGLNDTLNSIRHECESLDSWSSWVFGEEATMYQRYRCGLVVPCIIWAQSLASFFLSFQKSDFVVMVMLVCMAHTFKSTVHQLFAKKVVPLWYSARGICVIRGEAMQPGSSFRIQASMPRCQIPIYTPGVLYDTFLGYGIRYDDVLVMPTHVYMGADYGMLLKVDDKSFLLEATPIRSNILSDVSYFLMDKSVWARLGVQSAKVVGAPISPVAVTVVGPQGASSGYVSRNPTPYVLNYTGSTIPGYSGAPYVINGSVIGIHAGQTNGTNVGYGAGAIAAEIAVLIYGENTEDYQYEAKSRKRSGNVQFSAGHWGQRSHKQYDGDKEAPQPWRDTDVAKNVRQAQGQRRKDASVPASNWDDFGTDDHFDLNQDIVFDSTRTLPQELIEAFSDFSVAQLESIRSYLDGLAQVQRASQIRIKPHGEGSFDFVDVVADSEAPSAVVVTWQERMEERVTALELKLESLTKRQGTVPGKKPFPCGVCDKSFSSRLGKVSHEMTKHAEVVVPETAIRGDEKVEIGMKPASFLGKGKKPISTRTSPPVKKSISSSSSHSNPVPGPSGLQQTNQSKTKPSRKDIAKAFDSFQQVIFGLLEEQKQ